MFARILSGEPAGLGLVQIQVESCISSGLPCFTVVGLPNHAVTEARMRVRSALVSSGFEFPKKRIVINLAPASIKKDSTLLDLPIALAIIAANYPELNERVKNSAFFGELSLDGSLRASNCQLQAIVCALKAGFKEVFVPKEMGLQLAQLFDGKVLAAKNLLEVILHLTDKQKIESVQKTSINFDPSHNLDLHEVEGLGRLKRGLVIAAAGRHHTLLCGNPGTGKTMLARRLPTILPTLTRLQAVEVAALNQAEHLDETSFSLIPPFREPHYSTSINGLIGGGSPICHGEVTRAHHGVLFLDELFEYNRTQLEALRTPIELKRIHIARATQSLSFPCDFQLIAAFNPCPCGYLGHPEFECTCSRNQILKYQGRMSGPLIDRMDIQLNFTATVAQPNRYDNLSSSHARALIQESIKFKTAIDQQHQRKFSPKAVKLMKSIKEKQRVSRRRFESLSRVACTIANLAASTSVLDVHVAEAFDFLPSVAAFSGKASRPMQLRTV